MTSKHYLSLIRSLAIILLFGIETSCISVQENYLGNSVNDRKNLVFSTIPSAKEKQILQKKVDSLLLVISEEKRQGYYLRACEINQLYDYFGKQLKNDRYYNEVLTKNPIRTDSLSNEQYQAVVELLTSARYYQNTYQKERKVRRILNRGDRGNNIPVEILAKSRNFLYSPSVRKTLESNFLRYYSPEMDRLFNQLPETNTCIALNNRAFRNNDRLHTFFYNSVYFGSYAVGNSIGLFHESTNRKQNADILRSKLQPFDLVLMKSSRHLTDQFIPGYFGHVGIWLGNELAAQLRGKAMVKDSIKGRAMVEVLRSGVKISTLRDFADGEIFLIVRPKNLSGELKRKILSNIRKQLGKDYDFNFDIESSEAVTCTELVYLSYDFIDWKTRHVWLRVTLSPDDLVITALTNPQFEIPVLVENGVITNHPVPISIRSLVGEQDTLSSH